MTRVFFYSTCNLSDHPPLALSVLHLNNIVANNRKCEGEM